MMSAPSVKVHLPGLLRAAAGNRDQVEVSASTLSQALEQLREHYPLLAPHLFDEDGDLREHINLFVGERNSRWLEGDDARLAPGEAITILQAVSGG